MNKKNLVEYLQKLRKINRNFEYYLYSNIRGRIEQNNKTGLLKYLEKEKNQNLSSLICMIVQALTIKCTEKEC